MDLKDTAEALAWELGQDGRLISPDEAPPFALQAIIDGLSDELIVVDRQRRVRLANRATLERWPLGQDLLGHPCHDIYHHNKPCGTGDCECPVMLVLQTGEPVRVTHRLENGRAARYVDVAASPLRDATGEIAYVIELRRDVTDQRQLEDTLVRRNE